MKRIIVLIFSVLVVLGTGYNLYCQENYWQVEAEAPEISKDKAVNVVDDSEASGGKAIDIPSTGVPQWNVVICPFPAGAEPGGYRLKLHLKLDNIPDLGKAWRVDVRNETKLLGYGVCYGLYFEKKGYQNFSIDFDWFPDEKRPSVYMRWTGQEGNPSLRIDTIEFQRISEMPEVRIRSVLPNKIRYLANEDGNITVSIQNLVNEAKDGELNLEVLHEIDNSDAMFKKSISLKPFEIMELKFPFKNKGKLFGYEAKAILLLDGKKIDEKEEYFTVHDNPWAVTTGARDEELGDYYTPWHHIYYNIGATDSIIEEAAKRAREEYTTCAEFFSWSPGEAFYLDPKEEFWIRGNGGDLLRNKREIQKEVSSLKKYGIGCITYVAYQAMGERTIELARKKPEWFMYSDITGDLLEFYNVDELEKRKKFWEKFDWEKYKIYGNPNSPAWKDIKEYWDNYVEFWKKPSEECRKLSLIGYFLPNYKLPEVVDYCADEVINSTRTFGWDGLRWDCGQLNTGPIWGTYRPFVDFYGKPLAKTPEEMELQTIENLKRLKSRIRNVFPNFAFGTNFGSWGETHSFPKMTEELCKEGGWLLDEISYMYNEPTSPYHYWDKYYEIMADQGEYITSLGGHYYPFAFNRGGGKYPVDRLYETIFKLAGKGHPNVIYYNSCTPVGNFSQFSVRFGKFLFEPSIRRLKEPKKFITVKSAQNLWWENSVQKLKEDNKEIFIIHLINPPVCKEVEKDSESRLNPPVNDVIISTKFPSGAKKVTAWALTAEAWKMGDTPKTQVVPLSSRTEGGFVTVTIPQIIYWKIVVFQFE